MKRFAMKLMLLCGLALSCNASALNVGGIHLVDQVQMGNTPLQLNGGGVRKKWFFKVYVLGLYLPHKQTSAREIIDDDNARRIVMHMLRDLSSSKLYGAFKEGIEANNSTDVLAAISTQMKQMEQIFESIEEVKEGDIVRLDYQPGTGTQVIVNGTNRGTIAGGGFSRALMKVWLGDQPVQEDLKKGMLGG